MKLPRMLNPESWREASEAARTPGETSLLGNPGSSAEPTDNNARQKELSLAKENGELRIDTDRARLLGTGVIRPLDATPTQETVVNEGQQAAHTEAATTPLPQEQSAETPTKIAA